MRKILASLLGLTLIGAGAAWVLTAPKSLSDDQFAGLTGDVANGQAVFTAAGCASCHMAPDAQADAALVLAGGQSFASPFGTFLAPNISPDPSHGIGNWSVGDLGQALLNGVSPEGAHYYPAFPYWSYARMQPQDVVDLHAYMMTLPASDTASLPHDVGFPFSIRRLLGGWKLLNSNDAPILTGTLTPELERGRYVVEALAHCAECHTPRDALGGLDTDRWMAGTPTVDGVKGVPNITPAKLDWSADEIVEYLTSGFTPDYDSVGGHMAHVVTNMAALPLSDRQAVAAYLKALPARE